MASPPSASFGFGIFTGRIYQRGPIGSSRLGLLDAMWIARRTVCQLDKTVATATT